MRCLRLAWIVNFDVEKIKLRKHFKNLMSSEMKILAIIFAINLIFAILTKFYP